MKSKFILIPIIILLLHGCRSSSLTESIENYKSYFGKHKDDLDSIADYIKIHYPENDSIFNKIDMKELKGIFKKGLVDKVSDDVINDLVQIDYYKYGDSLRTVRIYSDVPKNGCLSITFFKSFGNDGFDCKIKNDSLYLGNCWSLFLIKHSPCFDSFDN